MIFNLTIQIKYMVVFFNINNIFLNLLIIIIIILFIIKIIIFLVLILLIPTYTGLGWGARPRQPGSGRGQTQPISNAKSFTIKINNSTSLVSTQYNDRATIFAQNEEKHQ